MKRRRKRPRCWQGSRASWSGITEITGKRWSCPSPARCYCSNCGQSSPGGSASWRSRGWSSLRKWTIGPKSFSGRGLGPWRKPGASCAWIERLLPAGLSSPVGSVFVCPYWSSAWEVSDCFGIAHAKFCEKSTMYNLRTVESVICCIG